MPGKRRVTRLSSLLHWKEKRGEGGGGQKVNEVAESERTEPSDRKRAHPLSSARDLFAMEKPSEEKGRRGCRAMRQMLPQKKRSLNYEKIIHFGRSRIPIGIKKGDIINHEGPRPLAGQNISFDEKGRRVRANVLLTRLKKNRPP